jgi:predicted DNA-binding WGR domain protein
MFGLAKYYEKQNDYSNMVKYYLLAIEQGNIASMTNIGLHYEIQKDYDNMLKYYLIAIDKG